MCFFVSVLVCGAFLTQRSTRFSLHVCLLFDGFGKKGKPRRKQGQPGRLWSHLLSLMFGWRNLRKSLKTLEKNDILSPFALCVGACFHHCDLMFSRMLSNASLRISKAFSACFLALCLARPSFQSQPEISILIWYLHTKNVKHTRQRVGGKS